MMYKELKKAILDWLLEHEHTWQRTNACHDAFRAYIYDSTGNYLIGGKTVSDFIDNADRLIYAEQYKLP